MGGEQIDPLFILASLTAKQLNILGWNFLTEDCTKISLIFWGGTFILPLKGGSDQKLAIHGNIQGVPKKRGISECFSVCFTPHLIWSLEYSFLMHLKIEIHVFIARTKQFLSDVRELRNIYQIFVFIKFNCKVVNHV